MRIAAVHLRYMNRVRSSEPRKALPNLWSSCVSMEIIDTLLSRSAATLDGSFYVDWVCLFGGLHASEMRFYNQTSVYRRRQSQRGMFFQTIDSEKSCIAMQIAFSLRYTFLSFILRTDLNLKCENKFVVRLMQNHINYTLELLKLRSKGTETRATQN